MKIKQIRKRREKRNVKRVDDCFNVALIKEGKNGAKFYIALIGIDNTIK